MAFSHLTRACIRWTACWSVFVDRWPTVFTKYRLLRVVFWELWLIKWKTRL